MKVNQLRNNQCKSWIMSANIISLWKYRSGDNFKVILCPLTIISYDVDTIWQDMTITIIIIHVQTNYQTFYLHLKLLMDHTKLFPFLLSTNDRISNWIKIWHDIAILAVYNFKTFFPVNIRGSRGRDRMVVKFTITSYHHWICEF